MEKDVVTFTNRRPLGYSLNLNTGRTIHVGGYETIIIQTGEEESLEVKAKVRSKCGKIKKTRISSPAPEPVVAVESTVAEIDVVIESHTKSQSIKDEFKSASRRKNILRS